MSTEQDKQNAAGCVGCLAVVVVAVAILAYQRQRHTEAVVEAHKVYDQGKHEEAVAQYKTLYEAASADAKRVMLPRIVKFELGKGNQAEARQWVERGLKDKLDVTYDDPAAAALLAAVNQERAAEEERKRQEKERAEAERRARQEEQDRAARARREQRARYGNLIDAREEAERLVKKLLKYPAEASISLESHLDPVESETNGRWVLRGTVTAKNAFGVRSEYTWVVKIARRENEKGWWWENVETLLVEGDKVVARSGTGGNK